MYRFDSYWCATKIVRRFVIYFAKKLKREGDAQRTKRSFSPSIRIRSDLAFFCIPRERKTFKGFFHVNFHDCRPLFPQFDFIISPCWLIEDSFKAYTAFSLVEKCYSNFFKSRNPWILKIIWRNLNLKHFLGTQNRIGETSRLMNTDLGV